DDQRSLFERAGIQLDFQPALPAPVFVDADWARLAQMVDNLLQNAAKFTNRGGRVSVSIASEREARRAVIRVVDNGIGISPQTLARLFQPFVQADSSLDRSIGGLGLGLALVKGLVELHGGTVRAESDGLGKGAQFVMELPLAAALEASSRPERPGRSARRRRVLVIEDNVDAADSLREALALDDHEVEVANDGPEGLVKARRFRPEVVLCDIGLPGMDGFEVARAFRMDETLKNVSLVALTGYALGADLERAAKAGFQRHLAKPASLEALQVLLSELPSETGPEEPRAAREA
ncbi:MAG TPA: ATP-binding protein, partial [Anaeromyxobacteraceae bacterium]|nr:ATP-binding protein [Anaeromyxobacteraceae bacterium]